MNEDLRKWFSQKWVRMDTKGNIKGDCAREEGEGKPKCLPLAKASSMDKEDRAAAARRKRREDPVADRSGKGEKPINVATEEVSTSDLIKKSHSKRGAPGTLKAKIQGPLTLAKVRSLKNRANATTLDKKQANFYINMHSEEYLEEKNVPTNPSLWARAKSLARSKFDVYPSAYANGWAAKWYKGKGGGWKSVQEGKQMKSLKDILSEGVAVSSDFKLVNTVNAQGKPVTRKVRAHRKTISPQSEDKSDVLTSIQNFVGRQYNEEVEQIDEVDSKTLASFLKKNPGYKVDTRSTKERIAASKEKSANQMKRGEPTKMAPASKADVDKQIAKSYSQHKPGQYVGDSVELDGEPIVEAKKSAAVRWQEALQKVKKQREEEEARKAANEKRALEPKKQGVAEAKDPREYDYEGDMAKTQLRSIIANSQAVHDMLKDTTNLAEWVQSKITKAEDYISTVADYMTAEMNEQTYDPFANDPEADAKHEAEVRAKMREKLQQGQGTKIKNMNPMDRDQYLQNTGRRWNDETKSIEKIKPQAAMKEAKEDDEEDYSKHHKLDPDSGVEADQHIHVQLKKAIDSTMKPYEVSFKNGKKHTVSSPVAKTIVTAIEKLKPEHRKAVHDELHKSYDSLMGVHKAITGK